MAKMANAKVDPTFESEATLDIAGMVHQDEGKARVKLYVSDVNKPLKVDPATLSKCMGHVQVKMTVTENKSVYNDSVYEKGVTMDQTIINDGNGNTTQASQPSMFSNKSTQPTQAPTGQSVNETQPTPAPYTRDPACVANEKWTKNTYDNLFWLALIALLVGGLGFALSAGAIGLIASLL
jgi:hypothetical protein